MDVTAVQILNALALRHAGDVFVPECKDGPSQYENHVRLDAWAAKCSWVNPVTWGYEIKVNRQDFIRDEKWRSYLGLCSDFYFVCPWKLIEPEEVGDGAGLLWMTKTGGRLYTKKKAPRREVEIPESLYRYILFSRVIVTGEHARDDSVTRWMRWLDEKREKRRIGYLVTGAIREISDRIEAENRRLKVENENYADVRAMLERLGITTRWHPENVLEEVIRDNGLGDLARELDDAADRVCCARDRVRDVMKPERRKAQEED